MFCPRSHCERDRTGYGFIVYAALYCFLILSILPSVSMAGQDMSAVPDVDPLGSLVSSIEPEDLGRPCFSGLKKSISLDLKGADVLTVIDLIARESGINIVVSPNVEGKVTMFLTDVPRFIALSEIMKATGLVCRLSGCVISIFAAGDLASRKELLKEAKEIARIKAQARKEAAEARKAEAAARMAEESARLREKVIKKEAGKLEPVATRFVRIYFADGYKLVKELKNYLSAAQEAIPGGTAAKPPSTTGASLITYDSHSSIIIIRARRSLADEMAELVKKLDLETPQVSIEARIVETSESVSDELGIQWGLSSRGVSGYSFPAAWGIGGGFSQESVSAASPGLVEPATGSWLVNLPARFQGTRGGALDLIFGNVSNTLLLDIRLSALEDRGKVKIVSHPVIATMNNREAVIKSGRQVPFQTIEDGKLKIDFKEAVIELKVRPRVVSRELVMLEVHAIKDEVDFTRTVAGNPTIFKKEAYTQLLMRSGGTMVIGGLKKMDTKQAEQSLPGLSKLPIINRLFKYRMSEKSSEELMIFITPKVLSSKAVRKSAADESESGEDAAWVLWYEGEISSR